MSSSKAAQAVTKFFAGYHEPSTVSPDKYRKLLDVLKVSFRTQLDREFGPDPNQPRKSKSSHRSESTAPPRDTASIRHLKELLSNPLLLPHSQPTAKTPSGTSWRDPMQDFDMAVSQKVMTMRIATGCLLAKRKQMSSAGLDLRTSDTAARVIQWLRLSGEEEKLDFLGNVHFLDALMPFLLAEKSHSVAWKWIKRIMNTPGVGEKDDRVRGASYLLEHLVRSTIQGASGNMTAAIATILKVEETFHGNELTRRLLLQPWRVVSWLSTVEHQGATTTGKESFDAHLETARLFGRRRVPVEQAHLHLYHPLSPDPQQALQILYNPKLLSRAVLVGERGGTRPDDPEVNSTNVMSYTSWIGHLARDTITYLRKSGSQDDALKLKEQFEWNFSPLIPLPST
ncbi:hypothetical protein B0I35DRAFT_418186 [Stachybotrys elegans]|uniref:Uncharacterized protein n=1 Tax=Stachybotrys elegans TaxID=80388 RepID=A0A8K0SZ16_9HYPO|nr:hypothetical protein B0I35DRAFT_418186 [Stachybotrys elegans]